MSALSMGEAWIGLDDRGVGAGGDVEDPPVDGVAPGAAVRAR